MFYSNTESATQRGVKWINHTSMKNYFNVTGDKTRQN